MDAADASLAADALGYVPHSKNDPHCNPNCQEKHRIPDYRIVSVFAQPYAMPAYRVLDRAATSNGCLGYVGPRLGSVEEAQALIEALLDGRED
jgi:hypothetical protein